LLNAFTVSGEVRLRKSRRQLRLIGDLLDKAAASFPIRYELDVDSRTMNAQAFVRSGTRVVRLYGGFACHPMVTMDALILALLHETGHHLATGHRLAFDPMLACDCAADQWAITVGAETFLHTSRIRLDIEKAVEGLNALISSMQEGALSSSGSELLAGTRGHSGGQSCWASDWAFRMFCLRNGKKIDINSRCFYNSHRELD